MKLIKPFILGLTFVLSAELIFAQNSTEIEEITLPDVSTIISGGAPKVGKSAVPDYSKVLPESNKNETVLPVLPDSVDVASENARNVSDEQVLHKNIYAEGVAGAGYPGFFTGNFSLYRQSGKNPFKVNFSHESANGYSGRSLTSGYFDRNTLIYAEKTLSSEKMDLFLAGSYENKSNGLQDKYEYITDVNKDKFYALVDWDIKFTKNAILSLAMNGDWYKRYATTTGSFYYFDEKGNIVVPETAINVPDYYCNVGVIDLNPSLSFTLKNSKNLKFALFAEYQSEYDTKNSFYETRTINRGNFGIDLGWHNDIVNLYGIASAVIGNEIGDNAVIVPFTVGTDFSFKNSLSSKNIMIRAKGGIESSLAKVEQLEREYSFTALEIMPDEVSNWYADFALTIPIKESFTFSLNGEFKDTAYGNDTWQPCFEIDDEEVLPYYGQYTYYEDDTLQLNSDVALGFRFKALSFTAGWKAYWLDVPCTKTEQELRCVFSAQNSTARFGMNGVYRQGLASSDDKCPIVDFSVFLRLTNAVRLVVSSNDVVKLISGTERTYAGKYRERSGSVAALVKFFF